MSDYYKVESLMVMGNSWNVSGMGTVYVSGLTSYTQTVSLKSTTTAKFWFPGNGVDSYLVASASITQGSLSTPVKVNGKASFYVPKEGRWSDWVSIANFALPGDVVFSFSIASLSSKIPAAASSPATPVGVSAYLPIPGDEMPKAPEIPAVNVTLPFYDPCTSLSVFTEAGGDENATREISDGYLIKINKILVPGNSNTYSMVMMPFMALLPDKFTVEIITRCELVPVSTRTNILFFLQDGSINFYLPIFSTSDELPEPYNVLYTPLLNSTQKWRFEIDKSDTSNIIMSVHHNDSYKITVSNYLSSVGSYSPGFGFTVGNHYDTGSDLKLHIKSIKIWEGITDRTLTESTQISTLTVTTNPAAGDTLTISGGTAGSVVFTFVDHYPNNANEIQIGVDVNATAANIATAINDITGAEFVATVASNVVTVTAHTSLSFSMSTTSSGISAGVIAETIPGFNEETVNAAVVFTATEGGKSVQENASASGSMDGLIDGLTEAASATAVIDCLTDSIEEGVTCNASVNIDGLIDYMGEEI